MKSAVPLQVEKDWFFPRRALPFLALLSLYGDSEAIRIKIAQNAPDYLRAKLVTDTSEKVRTSIAKNAQKEELRARLKGDKSKFVRSAVATYTKTTLLHEELSTDKEIVVRAAVARATESEALLEKFASDSSSIVVEAAARRIANPKVHRQLGKHPNEAVRIALATNRHISNSIMEELTSDSMPGVRLAVAINASKTFRKKLINDPNAQVRQAAVEFTQRDSKGKASVAEVA